MRRVGSELRLWVPAALLGAGILLSMRAQLQHAPPLRVALGEAVPSTLAGYAGEDLTISDQELAVAGMSAYLYRRYTRAAAAGAVPFTVYVGYYASQTQGQTIHSPKNCLPGAGWQALASHEVAVMTREGPVTVNYYLLQNGRQRALALYWYQGRGRVESNEYRVKWALLRDAAIHGRTEEALVRVVVPMTAEADALSTALSAAQTLIPAVATALPT